MKRWMIWTTLVIACLFVLSGCTGTRLAIDDNGSTLALVVGEPFTIILDANPTTGFEWTLAEMDDTQVMQISQLYIPVGAQGNIVGAGGVEVWNFEALAAGASTLRLEYRRPFDPANQPAEQEFEILVEIAPGA